MGRHIRKRQKAASGSVRPRRGREVLFDPRKLERLVVRAVEPGGPLDSEPAATWLTGMSTTWGPDQLTYDPAAGACPGCGDLLPIGRRGACAVCNATDADPTQHRMLQPERVAIADGLAGGTERRAAAG